MREISSHSKVRIAPVAIAAGLGITGMGLLSSGVAMADSPLSDSINVTVTPSCTFSGSNNDKNYAGSAVNGAQVSNFNDSGEHVFNLFCNNNNGFIVTATPHNLRDSSINTNINYTDTYTHSGADGQWTAGISSDATGVTVVSTVPAGGGTILSSSSHTGASGVSFTATYLAYVGSSTPAGIYTGTIEYTLTASGTTGGESGNDSGSGTGGSGTGSETGGNSTDEPTGGSSTPEPDAGTSSTQPNAAPLMTPQNNSYSTYNTYNTSNYQGAGSTVPMLDRAVTSSLASGESTAANGSSSTTGDSYEKPLGVTSTSRTSSSKNSGVDPVPIVVAGIIAASGISIVALAKSRNREED